MRVDSFYKVQSVEVPQYVTVKCPPSDTPQIVTVYSIKECPPTKTIKIYTSRTDTIYPSVDSTAQITVAKIRDNELKDTLILRDATIQNQSTRIITWRTIALVSLFFNGLFLWFGYYVWTHNKG